MVEGHAMSKLAVYKIILGQIFDACCISATRVSAIEIGLEQAPFVVFGYFFPHLNMLKAC
jgi:hypothetical protein